MYILKARNRYTCKDDTISRFNDERLFDSEIDKVNPETHSYAMVLDENNIVQKYAELKKPSQKVLTKTMPLSRP